ncbi:DNA topoisomerase (ATP-hydrolyzing) subunit B [Candidatus Kuenenbacteria bacterium]|nr:DNA topoisomerase (ATP-hydrolyzing) subunit B [Candidatus Kuenenbacteria bacterium]
MEKEKNKSNEYKADQIIVLEGLDPVKKRPGMYIGSTGSTGLHHLIWETVDNAIDEVMAGFCDKIIVELLPENKIRVTDNGRGIPVDIHKSTGKSALEVVMTKLHAGGKFGPKGGYKVSGGLHGVGISVVNALSKWMQAEVHRDGKIYLQEYKRGVPQKDVKMTGKLIIPKDSETIFPTGTIMTFQPDLKVFKKISFDWEIILSHLRQQAYLTKGVKIIVIDERDDKQPPFKYQFYFEGGIASYVKHLNYHKEPKHESVFYVEKEIDEIKVEIALQYTDEYKETIFSFANNIFTIDGGMHLNGFKNALTKVLNNYARKQNFLKEKDENLTSEDVREGLTAIISVKISEPQFEGQTKNKLGNPEVRSIVDLIFNETFNTFLEEHPREAEHILNKCILSAQARLAARQARESVLRKGVLEGITLPGKLADCSTRDAQKAEIFIVEGDSAGGCFDGNTKIALADGRNLNFKELIKEDKKGKKNYCYTINYNGNIEIDLIKNPRMTKKNTEVIKIILDNDEEIICTLDHKFMLRDGSYKIAKDLKKKNSLMPLYKKYSKIENRITIKGYEMILDPQNSKWIFTHLLADKYNLRKNIYLKEKGDTIHHSDFNKLNNNPSNLIRMSKSEHLLLHSKILKKTIHREDVKKKLRQLHKTKKFREKIKKIMNNPKIKKILSEKAKKQWQNIEYKNYMAKKFLEFYNNNAEYRKKNNELLNEAQKKYWNEEKNKEKQSQRVKNYFEKHPEKKEWLSKIAKKQWNNLSLQKWRIETTKKQWDKEFRKKRKETYNQTYLRKALVILSSIYNKNKSVDIKIYNQIRKEKNDKSLIRYETICQRFFNNDEVKFKEAILNYNHRIKAIVPLKEKVDVYDIEVSNTHNFALASGVFVHNSAKQGRDREFQAILPLRGKILNVEKARLDKMFANNEIKSLIIALGTNIAEQFNLEKLRYNKIVIMTDADVDGAHIRTLLLTLFYRYFPELINKGHLYVAQPPLYRMQINKQINYTYSEEEREEILKKVGDKSVDIQRYKGLGEMNPEQLWETTMDPKRRVIKQITIEDVEAADEIFDILMGSDVLPRKHFIQTHAKKVKNLDI